MIFYILLLRINYDIVYTDLTMLKWVSYYLTGIMLYCLKILIDSHAWLVWGETCYTPQIELFLPFSYIWIVIVYCLKYCVIYSLIMGMANTNNSSSNNKIFCNRVDISSTIRWWMKAQFYLQVHDKCRSDNFEVLRIVPNWNAKDDLRHFVTG